jgi:antitoxin (DNA-binding transcriptional repressor) of toxin-antitoxin stability system
MRKHRKPAPRKPATKVVVVRDLKAHAARILRDVRNARVSYILTHRGQAVGVILPLDAPEEVAASADDVPDGAAWNAFLRAGERIQGRFRPVAGGVRLLSESRR